jgi:predicted nucleic-acid-binding protein
VLAVDTNVLVRVLVDDPGAPKQCEAARKIAGEAGAVYVPQVVQIETVWVLERTYNVPKRKIVDSLKQLADNAAFVLQRSEIFGTALQDYRAGRADFSDYIILAECRAEGVKLATFDRKLGKHQASMIVDE